MLSTSFVDLPEDRKRERKGEVMEMMRIPLFLKGIQKTNSIKGTELNQVRLYSTQTLQTIAVYIGNLLRVSLLHLGH